MLLEYRLDEVEGIAHNLARVVIHLMEQGVDFTDNDRIEWAQTQ